MHGERYVWEEPRPGHVRINFLTPSGLHFREGSFEALASDPPGGPVVAAGTELMGALVQLTDDAPS